MSLCQCFACFLIYYPSPNPCSTLPCRAPSLQAVFPDSLAKGLQQQAMRRRDRHRGSCLYLPWTAASCSASVRILLGAGRAEVLLPWFQLLMGKPYPGSSSFWTPQLWGSGNATFSTCPSRLGMGTTFCCCSLHSPSSPGLFSPSNHAGDSSLL